MPSPAPPPPAPTDAGKNVDRTLLTGRRKRMGYESTILTGGGQGNQNLGGV